MIIRGFSASNVLKYRTLNLPNLPERGLIGIGGANEAGKSAIAEALCLALYGRTFSIPAERLDKLVRWGEPHAEVNLRFESGGKRYQVFRHIDREARQSAGLKCGEEQIASGPQDVNAAVARITGFDFSQYVDAFYLAQKELQTPHPQNQVMRGLLGIADLDAVAERLRQRNREDRRDLDALRSECNTLNAECAALNIDPQALDDLLAQQGLRKENADVARRECEAAQDRKDRVLAGIAALESGVETALALKAGGDEAAFQNVCRELEQGADAIQSGLETDSPPQALRVLRDWAADLAGRIDAFWELSHRADVYATRLRRWLGEGNAQETAADAPEGAYASTQTRLKKAIADLRARRTRNRLGTWLFGLSGLVGGVLWLLFSKVGARFPELRELTTARLPEPTEQHLTLLGGGAVALIGLALLIAFQSRGLRRAHARTETSLADLDREAAYAREETARLAQLDQTQLEARTVLITQLDDKDLHQAAVDFRENQGRALLDAQALGNYLKPLKEAARTWAQECDGLIRQADERLEAAKNTRHNQETLLAELTRAVEHERERRTRAEGLRDRRAQRAQAMAAPEKRIQVSERALDLIADACGGVYARFNVQMSAYLRRLIPRITHDRYRHLKIDDDFAIRLFSADKNDFLDLEDLSSGAQRQVLLAVRLAIAQALVDAHSEPAQTLMLDEPFAFFDRERINQTLKTLPDFSRQIGQIWVISQEFDADASFDLRIDCKRGEDVLDLASVSH